ncbi:MAG: 3-deoxy-D-manno-octulosonic acid transferase [Pseudomonadota bacterium]
MDTGAEPRAGPPVPGHAPFSLRLYARIMDAAGPLFRLWLAHRARKGKEIAERIGERFGEGLAPRPSGPILWVHGASVGEAFSALPLIDRLRATRPNLFILFTTGTVTSAALIAKRLPAPGVHQFMPLDRPRSVDAFLDHWSPDAVVWLESEIWPTCLQAIHHRGIPAALVNARMSDKTYRGWAARKPVFHFLMRSFQIAIPQNTETHERLSALGIGNIKHPANLKYSSADLPADEADLAPLRAALSKRPIFLAAQTGAGEEPLILEAASRIRERYPALLTIIVPRHPDRGDEIIRTVPQDIATARRSAGESPTEDTQVYLADTMGELGVFYRLAHLVFLGRSLVALGGSNLLEPARFAHAVLVGPHTENFAELAALI